MLGVGGKRPTASERQVSLFKRRNPNGSEAEASPELSGAGLPAPKEAAAQTTGGQPDNGLGVPPYRPATPKEAPAMARMPFTPSTPSTPPQPMPGATIPPGVMPQSGMSQGGVSPVSAPGGMPPSVMRPGIGSGPGAAPRRDTADRRTLVVGRGISVQGTVQDAERLVVEGTVEASMIHATELSISPGGVFKGEVEVEDAEVAGTIDGTLTARGNLIVRATGRVLGTARCRRLQVEDGGQITGRMEMLTETASPAARESAAE